jgi:V/A-type H+-transporting ATPase subunit I
MIFFPIFYGMMLGDAGYGLISLGLAYGLLKISPKEGMLYPFAKIWFYCAIPALVFGFIYDEFFGFPHHTLLEFFGIHANFYYGLERLHEIQRLLPITLLVGVIAMAAGFFFGFLNAFKEKHFSHAYAKLGWFFVVVSGTFLVSAGMFNIFPFMLIPSGIVFAIALIPILKAEGPIALIEIPGVAGNILSFARILAVGLASVVVAVILNDIVLPDPSQGLAMFITLPLYVFGHVGNTFLGMFESLIQGARLNYVEFFSKFYHGGGKAFTPFRANRKFTKE